MEEVVSSTDPPDCGCGFMSVERVYALLELNAGMRKDFNDRHMIFPHITFTCSGEVVQWIVAGKWNNGNRQQYPELQIWRPSGGTAYVKLNSTSLSPDEKENDDVYEYRADPPLPFQPGDVLGVWQPDDGDSRLQVRYDNAGDSVYYYTGATGNSDSFDTTANGVEMETDIPLVTVEIGKF